MKTHGGKQVEQVMTPSRSRKWVLLAAPALALMLPGCLSLSPKVPDSLLVLTAERTAPAGAASSGTMAQALAVWDIDAPQKLDVPRVPVQTADSTLAYLKDAVWVEKPARQFARLLSETIRAGGTRLVIEASDAQQRAATRLGGQLLEMGYDAPSQSVIVRFDAVLTRPDGTVATRRFENEVSGIPAEARYVGPALNQAANAVAVQVAEWVG